MCRTWMYLCSAMHCSEKREQHISFTGCFIDQSKIKHAINRVKGAKAKHIEIKRCQSLDWMPSKKLWEMWERKKGMQQFSVAAIM